MKTVKTSPSSRPSAFSVFRLWSVVAAFLLVSACATVPDPSDTIAYAEYQERNDPIEPFNRGVFEVNRGLDAMFFKPAAQFYRGLTPPFIQEAVTNFLSNLRTPIILANDLLQGEFERAGNTTVRFVINTTLGVAGLGDPATDLGYKKHDEDFGQTLASWGVGEGPFLMLPVIGPSNPRDAVGLAVDNFLFDPLTIMSLTEGGGWTVASRVRYAFTLIDARSRNYEALEDIERNSLDPYASLRSLYRQYREKEINQGGFSGDTEFPAFDDIPDFEDGPDFEESPDAGEPIPPQ